MRTRLTERDLSRIVRRVINEEAEAKGPIGDCFRYAQLPIPNACAAMAKTPLEIGGIVPDDNEDLIDLAAPCLKELALTSFMDPLGFKKLKVMGCLMDKGWNKFSNLTLSTGKKKN